MPALGPWGQMRSESSARLGASLGLGYRPRRLMPDSESGRLMPDFESWKKRRDSLGFLGCCETFDAC